MVAFVRRARRFAELFEAQWYAHFDLMRSLMRFRFSGTLAVASIVAFPLLLFASPNRHSSQLAVAKSPQDPALIARIQALSPSVSPDDARRVVDCAVTTGHELGRLWDVKWYSTMMPGIQNWLVKTGARKGGYCFQYSREVLIRLEALKLKTVEFHWAESRPGTICENNAIVVTAMGQPFAQGVLLDSWRSQPNLTWTQVRSDPEYSLWQENKTYAAYVLRNAEKLRVISPQSAKPSKKTLPEKSRTR